MFKKFIAIIVIVSFPFMANAVETSGSLKRLYINKDGLVLFSLFEEVNDKPSCATNSMWQYAFDVNDTAGKEMYSMLLTAKTAQKAIRIGHTPGACSALFSSTAVSYMFFND